MSKNLKIFIGVVILVAALSVGYYFLYPPKTQRDARCQKWAEEFVETRETHIGVHRVIEIMRVTYNVERGSCFVEFNEHSETQGGYLYAFNIWDLADRNEEIMESVGSLIYRMQYAEENPDEGEVFYERLKVRAPPYYQTREEIFGVGKQETDP